MKDLHTQASVFYLRDVHDYSKETAEEKSDNVSLYQGTMIECATHYFDEMVESGLIRVPEGFARFVQFDAEQLAIDSRMSGDWVQFEFKGQQWTCLNRNDH